MGGDEVARFLIGVQLLIAVVLAGLVVVMLVLVAPFVLAALGG